jgi:hypothetical protein
VTFYQCIVLAAVVIGFARAWWGLLSEGEPL